MQQDLSLIVLHMEELGVATAVLGCLGGSRDRDNRKSAGPWWCGCIEKADIELSPSQMTLPI